MLKFTLVLMKTSVHQAIDTVIIARIIIIATKIISERYFISVKSIRADNLSRIVVKDRSSLHNSLN
jgi:hypothetical protein